MFLYCNFSWRHVGVWIGYPPPPSPPGTNKSLSPYLEEEWCQRNLPICSRIAVILFTIFWYEHGFWCFSISLGRIPVGDWLHKFWQFSSECCCPDDAGSRAWSHLVLVPSFSWKSGRPWPPFPLKRSLWYLRSWQIHGQGGNNLFPGSLESGKLGYPVFLPWYWWRYRLLSWDVQSSVFLKNSFCQLDHRLWTGRVPCELLPWGPFGFL